MLFDKLGRRSFRWSLVMIALAAAVAGAAWLGTQPAASQPSSPADVKVLEVVLLDPPHEILVSQSVDVTVRTVLHNNGPFGPVSVDLFYVTTAPADCDVGSVGRSPQVELPVSVSVIDDHVWWIHCTGPSTHTLMFQTDIANIKEPHVFDPNPGNNSDTAHLQVDAIARADVKITSQELSSSLMVIRRNAHARVTLRKTLHNNGPSGPVDVSLSSSAVASPGCTAATHQLPSFSLPVSVSVPVDEVWTIRCRETGGKSFRFDNTVVFERVHGEDPEPGNNSASTELAVGVVSAADLRAFIGAWESIDIDGSYQRLMIGGGPKMSLPPDPMKPPYPYHIVYFDHGATACGGDQAIAIGYAWPPDPIGNGIDLGVPLDSFVPNVLVAELSGRCLKSGEALDGWMPVFVYEPELDVLVQETAAQCDDALDDDGDTYVNDGCPAKGFPETGAECANAVDDEADGYVNDGCPAWGVPETDGEPIIWERQGKNMGPRPHPER